MFKTSFKTFAVLASLAAATVALPPAANAKGCIKGAIVGGVAGHYTVHHGFLGAAAGCIIGRHEANKRAAHQRQAVQQNQNQRQNAPR